MTGQQIIDAAELKHGHAHIRVRDRKWANPQAYMRLSVLQHDHDGRVIGPWAHLFDRQTQQAIGEPTPQAVLTLMPPFNTRAFLSGDFDVWTGDLDPAEEETHGHA